jgi:hypothetical protein
LFKSQFLRLQEKKFAKDMSHILYCFPFRSQLPARATRLLNRRLQNNNNSPISQNGSDSPRSLDSVHSRNTPSSKTSLRDHLKQRQQQNLQSQLTNSSSEDLVVLDKTLTNSMLQDVVGFRKQLVHLRRILQEVGNDLCSLLNY